VAIPPPASAEVHTPAVNFLVSLGESPAAYLCPNFVGQSLDDARRNLEKAGLKVGEATPIPTETGSKGAILMQTPPPGSKIGPDTTFSFEIAQ
jgi:beta-lactam-binding protein with PASTA domain